MLIKYILEHWKRLLFSYLIGASVLFALFVFVSQFFEPGYRTKFTLSAKSGAIEVAHTLDNLFELVGRSDSVNFQQRMNMNPPRFAMIKSVEYDILDGNMIRIDLVTRDRESMKPFYHSLITFLNNDPNLNAYNDYAKSLVDLEIEAITSDLGQLDSSAPSPASGLWQLDNSKSANPVIAEGTSMSKVYFRSKLSELQINRFNLEKVRPLNEPVIPDNPEKIGKLIYFLFSNIIVLSLLFVKYLIDQTRNSIESV